MPHFVLEYSANLEDQLDVGELFRALNETALQTGLFATAGIRFRARRCEEYLIADAHPDNGFVHLSAKIGHGRAPALRRAAGEQIFNTLVERLDSLYATRPLAISFELSELTPGLSFKKNNLHEKQARGRAPNPVKSR